MKSDRERRKERRYRIDLPIRYHIFLPSQPHVRSRELGGRMYDLSLGGMRLLADAVQIDGLHILYPTIATSEQCLLAIKIEMEEELLQFSGQVLWYNRTAQESPFSFQIGIEFIDPKPEDTQRLLALCKRPTASNKSKNRK